MTSCRPAAGSRTSAAATASSVLLAQAYPGETAIRQVAEQAGFTRFRRAAETPFNAVYQARP